MSAEVALFSAVVGCDADQARQALGLAARLNIDPLDFARTRLGIGEAQIYQSAAKWAGLAYSAIVPGIARFPGPLTRVSELSEVRSMRLELLDSEILFVAPRFAHFPALAMQGQANPDTRRRICIVPPGELRRALAERSRERLIDYSRQNLSRIWPFATAHLDLGIAIRVGFVVALALLLVLAVVAPFWARPVLVPLLFVLLVLPAWFRIAAIVGATDPLRTDARDLLDDAELPVYSVLVPLRDEAHMVPQLVKAMRRIDYPALCIKRTN